MRIGLTVVTRFGFTWSSVILAAATTMLFALHRGQDVNWDQLNYHLSSPFLLMHGTFWSSIAPSGPQTFLNPLVLLPQYFLIRALPPIVAALTIALTQCLAFIVAARICLRIAGPDADGTGYRHALLGFVLCLASPMALSEAGTTIVDLLTAIPVLLAYHALLTREDDSAPSHPCLIAGFLLGAAIGLKLTNTTFAVGAPFFLLAGRSPPRRRAADLARIVLGGAVGFLLVAGYWHFELWQRFRNPTFPFFNAIFQSPDAPPTGFRDSRFVTSSMWDLVRYPVYWLIGGSPTPGLLSPASETDPKDARFALVLIALPVALLIRCVRRSSPRLLQRPETGFLLACLVDFVVWLYLFGIHRYMIPLEIMLGAVLLLLVSWIDTGRLRGWVLVAMTIVVLARIHVATWQRLPWAGHWRSIAAAPLSLPGAPIIFLSDVPSAFVALSLPDAARYVGLAGGLDLNAGNNTTLTRQLKQDLATAPDHSLYVVLRDRVPAATAEALASYGLRAGNECQPFRAADQSFRICDVIR